ncbi:MAG: shikimate dehydrogenase family protein, partial [Flavobacteriales bacterium]
KDYFLEKFSEWGMTDCVYENFSIRSIEQLPELLQSKSNLCGLNVTIPHKETVIPYLNELDPIAAEVGAVNCIRVKNGRTRGFNTDVYGFEMSVKPFLENHYERALILGTGGASKAVAYVLRAWGIPFHHVSRTPSNEHELSYDVLKAEVMHHFPLIINTTPLGTYPDIDACPYLPYEGLTNKHFLYDLIYNPEETTFLRLGRMAGAKTMNGYAMLIKQAEKSWDIWNESLTT